VGVAVVGDALPVADRTGGSAGPDQLIAEHGPVFPAPSVRLKLWPHARDSLKCHVVCLMFTMLWL